MSSACYVVPPSHGGQAFVVECEILKVVHGTVRRYWWIFTKKTPARVQLKITDASYRHIWRALGEMASPPPIFWWKWPESLPVPAAGEFKQMRIEVKSALRINRGFHASRRA